MDSITRPPNTTPRLPHAPEVVLVLAANDDHVKRIAELVSTAARRRCWIRTIPCEKALIESVLLTVRAESAGDPRLDASPTCKVYQCVCRLLEFWD